MTTHAPPEGDALDPAIRRGVLEGEGWALDRFFRAEHGPVYRLCLGLLADPGAAADVAQEAVLKLCDRLDRYDARRPWRAWRDAVVVRLCRDARRRISARRRAETEAGRALGALAGAARQGDPARALEAEELRALVADCVGSLTEREREAFVLRDLEGLSTEETALALGVKASTVRSLVTLARRRLRGLLAPRLGGAAPEDPHGIA